MERAVCHRRGRRRSRPHGGAQYAAEAQRAYGAGREPAVSGDAHDRAAGRRRRARRTRYEAAKAQAMAAAAHADGTTERTEAETKAPGRRRQRTAATINGMRGLRRPRRRRRRGKRGRRATGPERSWGRQEPAIAAPAERRRGDTGRRPLRPQPTRGALRAPPARAIQAAAAAAGARGSWRQTDHVRQTTGLRCPSRVGRTRSRALWTWSPSRRRGRADARHRSGVGGRWALCAWGECALRGSRHAGSATRPHPGLQLRDGVRREERDEAGAFRPGWVGALRPRSS